MSKPREWYLYDNEGKAVDVWQRGYCPTDSDVHVIEKSAYEELAKALRFAAGYISATPDHSDRHPQDVYEWLIQESKEATE